MWWFIEISSVCMYIHIRRMDLIASVNIRCDLDVTILSPPCSSIGCSLCLCVFENSCF